MDSIQSCYSHKADEYSNTTRLATLCLPGVTTVLTGLYKNKPYISVLLINAILFAESTAILSGLTRIAKGTFHRSRPFVYNDSVPTDKRTTKYASQSMWSGHAAVAFNSAVFAGFTFQKQNPGSPHIKLVWGAGLSMAAATAILRVTSGHHFPTDVIIGATIGSFTGWFIPWMHLEKNRKFSFYTDVNGTNGLGFIYSF